MEVSSVVHALKKKQDFLHEGFQRGGGSAGQRGEISVQCFRDSGQHLPTLTALVVALFPLYIDAVGGGRRGT